MNKMYKNLILLCCMTMFSLSSGVFAQANDLCVDAEAILTDGTVVIGDNTLATATADGAGSVGAPELWYTFTGNGNPVTIETTAGGTLGDTQLAVFDACAGLVLANNDDGGEGLLSLIDICAEAGVVYLVEVQGFGGAVGTFNVSVTDNGPSLFCDDVTATNFTDPLTVDACATVDNALCVFGVFGCADALALNFDPLADSCDGVVGGTDDTCCTYPPANDDCAGAFPIICGETLSGSSLNSTIGSELLASECGTIIEGAGVWYSFSSATAQEITFSTCGSALDTKINVYTGTCGAFICAGGNDDDCGVQSVVTIITPAAATDYLIHISGWNGNVGDFDLSVECGVATCTVPLNDLCDGAFPLPDATALYATNLCAQGNDLSPSCAGFGNVDGIWYEWNSGANNALTLDFAPAAVLLGADSAIANPSVAVFSGNCASPTELGCFNGAVVGGSITGLTLNTDYLFLVFTDADVDQGHFDITVTGGVAGCNVALSCNFDPAATVNDGTCDFTCLGCTDPLAINFDATSTIDDGSCAVPGCDPVVTSSASICYESGATSSFNVVENTPGEGVVIEFTSGVIEAGWDVINIFDDLGAQLNTQIDGDLTGLVFSSAGGITIDIIADASFGCATGEFDPAVFTVYCGVLEVVGCFDPLATNFNPDANAGDQALLCEFLGCIDPLACNFNPLALTDDGTCCLGDCITVTVGDTFGDGGTTVTLLDDLGASLGSVTTVAFDITAELCIPSTCVSVFVTTDGFPGEASVLIESSVSGVLVDFATGSLTGNATAAFAADGATGCIVDGCVDPTALNFCPLCNADCLAVVGGADNTCCIYPVANNDCDGAIALVADVEAAWDSSLTSDSGNNCSPTLTNDMWYTYTPACDVEVTITSTSGQGGELAIWEGDCASLTLVQCAPNQEFTAVELVVILTGGTTYSIQTGSNSDFSPTSTGTIILTEGLCRGCTYADADNFDPAAGVDDASCVFPDCSCPGDFTGDGFVNVSDLGGFLGAFGDACP